MHTTPRTLALVGPGRAGTALALALVARGTRVVGLSGRSERSVSTRAAVARLGAPVRDVADVGRGADVVLVTTPDAVLTDVATALAPGLEPGALVVHCSGARGLDALAPLAAKRPDVALGALHPLQTFAHSGPHVLDGVWAAVAGPPVVDDLATALGLRPFAVPDDRRAAYHAAAAVASNHLVALLGQVDRLAAVAGVPTAAFAPLVRTTLANVEASGPAAALTGPVARGDVVTVAAHLAALDPSERDAYRALAGAALVLTGRDDPSLRALLVGDPVGAPTLVPEAAA